MWKFFGLEIGKKEIISPYYFSSVIMQI